MRSTFIRCRSTSVLPMYTTQGIPISAQTVAAATPCCPAPRLGDDAPLAQLPGHENLPHGVVDLVRTRVVEVLALEINPAPVLFRQPLRRVQGRRAAHIVAQQTVEFATEFRAFENGHIAALQLLHGTPQNLRYIGSAECTVIASFIDSVIVHHILSVFVSCKKESGPS